MRRKRGEREDDGVEVLAYHESRPRQINDACNIFENYTIIFKIIRPSVAVFERFFSNPPYPTQPSIHPDPSARPDASDESLSAKRVAHLFEIAFAEASGVLFLKS